MDCSARPLSGVETAATSIGMSTSNSWMPKGKGGTYRVASSGQFIDKKTATPPAKGVAPPSKGGSSPSKSSPSSHFSLRDGTVITSVRKDVMDRALGRGEFGKK